MFPAIMAGISAISSLAQADQKSGAAVGGGAGGGFPFQNEGGDNEGKFGGLTNIKIGSSNKSSGFDFGSIAMWAGLFIVLVAIVRMTRPSSRKKD